MLTVYDIVTVPLLTPVTTPPDTVAFELLALQVPPATTSVNVMFAPTLTADAPVIIPAETALTVTVSVAAEPQPVL